MAERWYLDVAAERIQQWLARTSDLKGWRGASAALSLVTAREQWEEHLPEGMEWNLEAGDLDGVVSLRSKDGMARPEAQSAVVAAGRQVVEHLRGELPDVMLRASVAWAESYGDAYEQFGRASDRGDLPLAYLPAPAELVMAKPCDACRGAPATPQTIDPPDGADGPWHVCADCLARYQAAGATASRRTAMTPRAQQRLGAALVKRHTRVGRFPTTFDDLTATGDSADTQLALIYADGNRVGQFLRAATEYSRGSGRPAKGEIVTAIDAACMGAMVRAVESLGDVASQVPVLPHVAGGDDVLVSVAAGNGWPFVRALLTKFGTGLDRSTRRWPEAVRRDLPSMSAGVVFHHRTAPFPDMVRLAKRMLGEAKQHTAGKEAAVQFVDVTVDGGAPPASRRPMTAEQLTAREGRVAQVAALPASQRATLLGLLRIAAYQDAHPERAAPGESAAASAARRVVDSDELALWWITVDGAGLDEGRKVRDALEGDPVARDRLRTALDLARHWPPARESGGTAGSGRAA